MYRKKQHKIWVRNDYDDDDDDDDNSDDNNGDN
jgi:hypothetical protein